MLVAFLVALVFAIRFGLAVWHWGTLPVDPQLEGWMTPRFIAHSWDVPPDVVQKALPPLEDGLGRRVTLDEIAQAQGIALEQVLNDLRTAIAAHRAERAP